MTLSRRHFGALSAGALLTGCDTKQSNRTTIFRYQPQHILVEGRFQNVTLSPAENDPDGKASTVMRLGFPGTKIDFLNTGSTCAIHETARGDLAAWDIKYGDNPWSVMASRNERRERVIYKDETFRQRTRLIRRTEAWQGLVDIHEIVSDLPIQFTPLPKRKLLFIGDSITCGANSELSGADGQSGDIVSNARLSYGRILGDALDAQAHLVAYGGKGLVRDWQGLTTEVTAPQFFERALPDDPNSVWNHSQYIPDSIGVCLGQNDFNQGIPDRESWVGTYVKFLRRIRETAPKATIFVINSPMSRDDGPSSKGGTLLSYLDEITRTASDPLIKRANVSHYPGVTPTDGHPSTASHAKIAAELLPAFTKVFK